ncbi:MAG: hypothetical protein M3O25_04475 [Actinomycetota bacterium]|nr:hypothetical protein [Actinomycetota bacterium]
MKSILSRRPSPALVISCVALFVSLGGVSYGVATGFIDSREIKNNQVRSSDLRNNSIRTFDIRNNEVRGFDIRNSSVQGRDVALNTLTGADVSEQDLEKVPSATAADTATSVGGITVKKFFVKQPTSTPVAEIFRGEGFALEAGCSAGSDPTLRIDGIAGGPATNVTVEGVGTPMTTPIFASDLALVAGDNVDLLPAASTGGAGTATVSTTAGVVTTIVYGAVGSPAFTGESACAVRGTVTSG